MRGLSSKKFYYNHPKITCVPSMARNVQGRLDDVKKSLTPYRWYFRINVVCNMMPTASSGKMW